MFLMVKGYDSLFASSTGLGQDQSILVKIPNHGQIVDNGPIFGKLILIRSFSDQDFITNVQM